MNPKRWWSIGLFLAVLATVALLQRSRVSDPYGCQANLRAMAQAVDRFAATRGRPPGKIEHLVPEFMPTVPICRASRRPSYALFTGITAPLGQGRPGSYYLFCHGNQHPGYKRDYPAYSKTGGIVTGPPWKWRR